MRRECKSRFSSSAGKSGLEDWSVLEGGTGTCSGIVGFFSSSSPIFPRGSCEAQSWLRACVVVNRHSTGVRDGSRGEVGRTPS